MIRSAGLVGKELGTCALGLEKIHNRHIKKGVAVCSFNLHKGKLRQEDAGKIQRTADSEPGQLVSSGFHKEKLQQKKKIRERPGAHL